jgi:amino acid permease
MSEMILSILSVCFFCLCCHQLIRSVMAPIPVFNETSFNKTALKLSKGYRVFSWSLMTLAFLVGLSVSFYQIYFEF